MDGDWNYHSKPELAVPAKKAWHEMESNEMVHHSSFGKHHGGRIDYPSPPAAPCDRSRHRLLWAVRWASWKGRSRPRPRGFWSKCTSTGDWTIHPVFLINQTIAFHHWIVHLGVGTWWHCDTHVKYNKLGMVCRKHQETCSLLTNSSIPVECSSKHPKMQG